MQAASEPTLLDVWDQRWFYGIKKVQVVRDLPIVLTLANAESVRVEHGYELLLDVQGCLDSHNLQWLTEAVVSELEVLRGIIHGVEVVTDCQLLCKVYATLPYHEMRPICKSCVGSPVQCLHLAHTYALHCAFVSGE